MVVVLSSGGKQIDFAILVLENDLGAVFVREHPEDGIVRLVLHHHILVLDVVELNFGGVVQADEESFVHEELHDLLVGFKREYLWLVWLVLFLLYLVQVNFVFVRQNCHVGLVYIDMLYREFTVYFVNFLHIVENCTITNPTVELYGIAPSCSQVAGPQRNTSWLERQIELPNRLALLF